MHVAGFYKKKRKKKLNSKKTFSVFPLLHKGPTSPSMYMSRSCSMLPSFFSYSLRIHCNPLFFGFSTLLFCFIFYFHFNLYFHFYFIFSFLFYIFKHYNTSNNTSIISTLHSTSPNYHNNQPTKS